MNYKVKLPDKEITMQLEGTEFEEFATGFGHEANANMQCEEFIVKGLTLSGLTLDELEIIVSKLREDEENIKEALSYDEGFEDRRLT